MKKISILVLTVAAAISGYALADGSEEELRTRNRTLEEMRYMSSKLHLQAEMAKSFKDMKDAGLLVDDKGVPMGIGGNIERLAEEVRKAGGVQPAQGPNAANPFGGTNLGAVLPQGQNLFGDSEFGRMPPPPMPAPVEPPPPAKPIEAQDPKVEVVAKPTEIEKKEGVQVLRLVELRGQTAIFFTNDGFKEVAVGGTIYGMKLASLGVDSASLKSKDGVKLVRIDWSKSVRYSDK
jgi:hypothetical protein